MAIAAGKTNASRLQVGDRILVIASTDKPGHALLSHRKTGEGVHVARVTFKEWVPGGRRGTYTIYTTSGISVGHQAIQTMWLAPEDAAGVKRAHVEALALNATYDAYPLAEDTWPADHPDARIVHAVRPSAKTPEPGWASQCVAEKCPGHWRTGMDTEQEARDAYVAHQCAPEDVDPCEQDGCDIPDGAPECRRCGAEPVENVDPELLEEAVRQDQEVILTHDVRPAQDTPVHYSNGFATACGNGSPTNPATTTSEESGIRCDACRQEVDRARSYRTGQPTQEAQERLMEAGAARGTLDDYQAAVAELDGGQRASLAAGMPVVVTDLEQASRVVRAITDRHSSAVVMAGGQGVPTTVQTVPMEELMAEVAAEQAAQEVAASLEAPALVVRASESLVQPVVSGPESRVVPGDVVRIHRGTRLYEVLRVEEDLSRDATDPTSQWEKTVMARLVPCDPEDQRDPGWVNTDLLHRVPPVARVTGVLVEAYQELADDVVAVAGTGWDTGRGVMRQPGLVSSPGSRPPYGVLIPVEERDAVPVGCLRIGDAIVINQRCFRVVWDGGPAEPHLEPARWRDR